MAFCINEFPESYFFAFLKGLGCWNLIRLCNVALRQRGNILGICTTLLQCWLSCHDSRKVLYIMRHSFAKYKSCIETVSSQFLAQTELLGKVPGKCILQELTRVVLHARHICIDFQRYANCERMKLSRKMGFFFEPDFPSRFRSCPQSSSKQRVYCSKSKLHLL